MKLENKINDWVVYFIDEWEDGDNNVYKIPLDEDDLDEFDSIDEHKLHELIDCLWIKDAWLYIELSPFYLKEQYNEKMKQWSNEKQEEFSGYWNDRL